MCVYMRVHLGSVYDVYPVYLVESLRVDSDVERSKHFFGGRRNRKEGGIGT